MCPRPATSSTRASATAAAADPIRRQRRRASRRATRTSRPASASRTSSTYYRTTARASTSPAPGGARKFNLPTWDRGGTPGFPYTDADGTTAFEDFSSPRTGRSRFRASPSRGRRFYPDECYSTIQGTSMATPHVSAVAASDRRVGRACPAQPGEDPQASCATEPVKHNNLTPPLSATDTSPGDRTGVACPTGYCHLGGPAISDRDAYGAGIVDAYQSVKG